MTRRTQTYAVRLAVEGGGQVKAELVSVGQSGEQSLKRIEAGGGDTPRCCQGIGLSGTPPADFIRASGQKHRTNRPNT